MKIFKFQSDELSQVLQVTGKALASRNALPILDEFLMRVEADTVSVTASDDGVRLTSMMLMPSGFFEGVEGDVMIPAKRVMELLKALPPQPVELRVDGREVVIKTRNAKYSVTGMDPAEYPQERPFGDDAVTLSMNAKTLVKGIKGVAFAVDDGTLRPVMTCVLMDIKDDGVTFVASDGHKLALVASDTVTGVEPRKALIPSRAATLLADILDNMDTDVEVTLSGSFAKFSVDGKVMSCRLMEGKYPNYASVIPTMSTVKVVTDRKETIGAVSRVLAFSDKSSSLVRVRVDNNQGIITVAGQDLSYNLSAEERLRCLVDGDDVVIGFNGRFLIEALKALNTDDVTLDMIASDRAAVMRPASMDCRDTLVLLMPMSLGEV